jgi:hypothetical protein
VLIGAGFPQPGAPSLRWIFYLPTWVQFRMPNPVSWFGTSALGNLVTDMHRTI